MPAAMIETSEIHRRISEALPGAEIEVNDLTGGQDHYQVKVISDAFAGMSALERHRKVYGLFDDVIGGALHALSLALQSPND